MTSGYSFDLCGRTILITGASSGLGRHFGRLVTQAGGNAVLAARRVDPLNREVETTRASGGSALGVALDVGSEESTIAAFELAEKTFGVVDTVIANAGISAEALATDIDVEAFDSVVSTNLRGVF